MNWFQHDTASTQDAKIKKLLIRHGAVGYAVYFHCLELIASDLSETNLTFELEHDSEIIADNLRIQGTGEKSGIQIVEEIMRTIVSLDLFSERNGHIFCFKLIKRINLSQTSKPAFRAAITNKRAELLPIMINHDPIMTHHDPIMTHHDPIMNTNQQYQPTIPTNNTEPSGQNPQKPHSFYSPSDESISTRFENHRKAWNYAELPGGRFLFLQLSPDDISAVKTVYQAYDDDEIEQAINNYKTVISGPGYDLPEKYQYGTFVAFLKKGVVQYVDSAKPLEKKRKATGCTGTVDDDDYERFNALMPKEYQNAD